MESDSVCDTSSVWDMEVDGEAVAVLLLVGSLDTVNEVECVLLPDGDSDLESDADASSDDDSLTDGESEVDGEGEDDPL